MKILIRATGMKLSKIQRAELTSRLGFTLARFGERIGRASVHLSEAVGIPGYKRCVLDVHVNRETVTAEHSDINIFLALEHAASRAARSVGRVIEREIGFVRG